MHSAQLEISASRVVRHRDRPNHIVTATSKPRDSSLLWRICRVSLHSLVMFGSLTWVHISSSSPTRPIMRSTCLHGPIITQSIAHPGEVATGICSVAGRLTTLIHLERSCAKLQAQLTVKYDSVQLPEPPPGALPLDVAGGSVSKPPSSLPRTISGSAPELPSVAFCWHSCHEHDVRVSLSFSTHPIHLALST